MKKLLPVVMLVVATASYGQAYPTKPVRLVVPFGPGGSSTKID